MTELIGNGSRGDIAGISQGLREAGIVIVGYSVLFVAPVMALLAPWIAGSLTESEISGEFTQKILYLVPLSCLLGAPFLLCRPVFEGMQRGSPGLITALVRYLVMTLPMAWIGIKLAESSGFHPIYGLVVGVMAAALFSSAMISVWLGKTIRQIASS